MLTINKKGLFWLQDAMPEHAALLPDAAEPEAPPAEEAAAPSDVAEQPPEAEPEQEEPALRVKLPPAGVMHSCCTAARECREPSIVALAL